MSRTTDTFRPYIADHIAAMLRSASPKEREAALGGNDTGHCRLCYRDLVSDKDKCYCAPCYDE